MNDVLTRTESSQSTSIHAQGHCGEVDLLDLCPATYSEYVNESVSDRGTVANTCDFDLHPVSATASRHLPESVPHVFLPSDISRYPGIREPDEPVVEEVRLELARCCSAGTASMAFSAKHASPLSATCLSSEVTKQRDFGRTFPQTEKIDMSFVNQDAIITKSDPSFNVFGNEGCGSAHDYSSGIFKEQCCLLDIDNVVDTSDICNTSLAQLDAVLLSSSGSEVAQSDTPQRGTGMEVFMSPVSSPALSPRQACCSAFSLEKSAYAPGNITAARIESRLGQFERLCAADKPNNLSDCFRLEGVQSAPARRCLAGTYDLLEYWDKCHIPCHEAVSRTETQNLNEELPDHISVSNRLEHRFFMAPSDGVMSETDPAVVAPEQPHHQRYADRLAALDQALGLSSSTA